MTGNRTIAPAAVNSRLFGPALLCTALALYAFASLYQLHLPGLYYDEALDAVPAVQLLAGQPIDVESSFRLFGRDWPLMVMTYVGPTTTYLTAAAFGLFGVSVAVLRLVNIGLGLLTLVLAWGFLAEFFDRRVAGVATLLLAVNPTFVFWSRLGAFVSLPMLPLGIGAVWSLYRWRQRRRGGYLVLAAFLLGVGLSTKLLFLWFWLALGLAWLLLSPLLVSGAGWRAWLWPFKLASWQTVLLAVLALLVGCAPLLAYNLSGLGTLNTVLQNARQTELYGVDNLNILHNLGQVIVMDLRILLDGSWFRSSFGAAYTNPLAVPALIAALGLIIWMLATGRQAYPRTRILLLLILFVSITAQSAITITSLGATHLMILWPIPQALIAIALWSLVDLLTARPHRLQNVAVLALPVIVALTLVASEALTTARYHRTLTQIGGEGAFSDSIPALAADLEQEAAFRPIAMDWGFRRSLQLLTAGRVNPEERFEYSAHPSEAFSAYINDAIARTSRSETSDIYLFHTPEYTVFPSHWEQFEEAAYRYGMTPVVSHMYRLRDGKLVSLVYRLEPAATLRALPPTAQLLDVRLGAGLQLLAYEAPNTMVRAGETLTLTLYWRAEQPQAQSYKVFAHLIGPNGQLVGQHDSIPRFWGHPTTKWQVGEIVADRVRIPVNADATPGVYRIFVGMYDDESGQRAPLWLGNERLQGDTLGMVEITVTDTAE